ncbi:efflux RND transporter periplasmic adaptor subunit [Paucibacter sp. KCTC 42545]|uniref:efflux RND transporter periplasmic adaptor subunit n=1 Tax=Paucibacter sp. KCTC 42545 TaxID=1768242 RepID=UPI000733A238|nr:efflux RND transporter periplasmic adaptor subunit [Paucibacter sp. KCTC 42545]ALT78421.1 hypothetical protein AT984_15745 [Paucibacter sp. KCTC 42545]
MTKTSPHLPELLAHMPRSVAIAAMVAIAGIGFAVPSWAQQAPAKAGSTASPAPLSSLLLRAGGNGDVRFGRSFDGVVEAQRQTVMASQVAGAIVQIEVKPGDRVSQGQILLRIDARAANEAALASEAQAQAAHATLQLATRDFERQQQLFKQRYISQAALDQAESQFKATQAQVNAQLAQASGARTQSSLHVVRSPYAGVVSEVPVALGDMAMPGRALLTVYDPKALRVTANVPQSVVSSWGPKPQLSLELAGQQGITPARVQVLPVVDAATHSVQLRLDLADANLAAATPGMFARLWLSEAAAGAPATDNTGKATGAAPTPIMLPRSAVVRRAELNAAYVLDAQGRPLLRQLRLGRVQGEMVEVLSGLNLGERVATDPAAAARWKAQP